MGSFIAQDLSLFHGNIKNHAHPIGQCPKYPQNLEHNKW